MKGAHMTKVYIYTRVSTAMQIDGYSLEAQKSRMKAFADYNGYEIAGEYEDAGKSGKSIEGRTAFNQMMDDIKTGKDDVSYVLVFKLSRFGRNAADVLSTLQVMQDFGVNLICVENGIDSSKDAGKHRMTVAGQKCTYKKQVREELLDETVAEVISKMVGDPKFAAMMQERINMKVDTTAIEQEIEAQEKFSVRRIPPKRS